MYQKKEIKKFNNKIKNFFLINFYFRLIGEFFCAFILIGLISVVFALGQTEKLKGTFFYTITNVNILYIIWISLFSVITTMVYKKTGITTSVINLVVSYKNKEVKTLFQFLQILLIQIISTILCSFALYFIVYNVDNKKPMDNSLGGISPTLKSMFTNSGDFTWDPIDFSKYGQFFAIIYSIFQGLLNAVGLLLIFVITEILEKKINNYSLKYLSKFVTLIIISGILSIFSANTSNATRILAPAIVDEIFNVKHILLTTIIYIVFQSIGTIILYYEKLFTNFINKFEGDKYGI